MPKGWTSAGLLRRPERLTTPAGARRDRRARAGVVGRGPRPRRRPASRAPQAAVRRGRGRGLRRRRADQREGLPARQVRPGRAAAPARSTTTAAGACRRPPPPATGASALDRGLPFPLADIEQADVVLLVGSNLAETMPPAGAAPRPAARARRPRRRHRPAPHADRATGADGGLHLQPRPRHRPARSRSACCTCWSPPAPSTRTTSPPAPPASTTVRPDRGAVVARAGRAGHRRPGLELRAAVAALLAGRGTERDACSTARGAEQHARAPTPCSPASTSPSRSACPGNPGTRLRLPHRPGQRPGRPRARPEGRPAARLPHDRRPRGPRARRRACGASTPRPARARVAQRLRAARRARHRRRPARCSWSSAATSSCRRPTPARLRAPRVARPARRRRLRAVRDRGDGRRRPPGAPSGPRRTARMTNLEGRVILRAAGGRRRRPACRSDLDVIAGLAARLGSPVAVRHRPRGRLRRARAGRRPAGRPTTPGIDLRPDRAASTAVLAVPDAEHPGHAAAVPRPFATPDGRARFVAVDHVGAAEQPDADYPAAPHHRPGARAVPVRRPDPPRPRADGRRRASCSSSCTRHWPSPSGSPTATWSDVVTRRGRARAAVRVDDDDPPRHRLRAVPLGGGRQPAHQRRARPVQPACPSSRCAPSRLEAVA